jgi:hypothetical protein
MGSSGSKKGQLAPISFTNKSVDLNKVSEADSKNHESSKFNTSNYSDIYSEVKATSPESKVTTSFDKKFGFEQKEKIEEKKEEPRPSAKINSYSFKNEDDNKDKEFDGQFNEVILEEIENDNKNKVNISNLDDFEDSKKSVTQSNSNAISFGFDNSVTNYKIDEFDHIEEVEPQNNL